MSKLKPTPIDEDGKEINSGGDQISESGGKGQTSAFRWFFGGVKEALIIILLGTLLAYAIVQPWIGESVLATLRQLGVIIK